MMLIQPSMGNSYINYFRRTVAVNLIYCTGSLPNGAAVKAKDRRGEERREEDNRGEGDRRESKER